MNPRLAWLMGVALATVLPVTASMAQSGQSLPREVEAARREAAAACMDAQARFKPGYIQTADFNGDGRPDYVVNDEMVDCPGSPPLFCGSGGCSMALYLSAPTGYQKIFEGLGSTPRIDRQANPPILVVPSRTGTSRLQWNGQRMVEVRRR